MKEKVQFTADLGHWSNSIQLKTVLRTRFRIMIWAFGGLIIALLCFGVNGSQSLRDVQWLPCDFVDELLHLTKENHIETEYFHREAVLQFGDVGDTALHPKITFLVTVAGSKVDMRRYLEGNEDTVQCEIRRYSTGGIVMRWPTAEAEEHDVWFTCTLRHTQGLFVISTFLRHTPAAPAVVHAHMDFHQWKSINDRELLTTSAAMIILTQTPSVMMGFLKEPVLHCKFAVDHKLPNVTVEWKLQRHGEHIKLFSYSIRTGKAEGSGVTVKTIAAGNASYKLPLTKKNSEGTYVCSVKVPPLIGSHDIPLSLSEQPRVSINVGSTVSMMLGKDQKLICNAEGYYPLDVDIEWYREPPEGVLTPLFLESFLSSHRHLQDGTYSLSASLYLQPRMEDNGYKYTCRVSHKSLLTPIHRSFYLTVTEPDSTLWYLEVYGSIILMLLILFYFRPRILFGRRAVIRSSCLMI